MKRNKVMVLLFTILLIIGIYFLLNNQDEKNEQDSIQTICIQDKTCFEVDVADTQAERETGLSDRISLEEGEGMFFVFPMESRPGFWMKNMNFSIDIIWIDENFRIIGIEKNLQLCLTQSCPVFYPSEEIKYVLEINSGLADKNDFEIGNSVDIR